MPRTNLMDRKSFDFQDLDVVPVCPAADRIRETLEGPGVRCRIEGSRITAARDASSLQVFCQGEHTFCPTWREARAVERGHLPVSTLTTSKGMERTFTLDDALEVQERLESGDLEGAERIRARIEEARAAQGLKLLERE